MMMMIIIIQRQNNNSTWYNIALYSTADNSKSYMTYRMAPSSAILNDS